MTYDYNRNFIVVKQKPNYQGFKDMIGSELLTDSKQHADSTESERVKMDTKADSILKHDPFYQSVFQKPG
ncbi:hypothetical protein [Mucilaginibacter sp. CSA2-8R]|uniref:hypothetical protein n=1 Tax=Mucilaginibacter sp. CSA2-8R TaxID=3141542 RepID=UPI00315DBC4F